MPPLLTLKEDLVKLGWKIAEEFGLTKGSKAALNSAERASGELAMQGIEVEQTSRFAKVVLTPLAVKTAEKSATLFKSGLVSPGAKEAFRDFTAQIKAHVARGAGQKAAVDLAVAQSFRGLPGAKEVMGLEVAEIDSLRRAYYEMAVARDAAWRAADGRRLNLGGLTQTEREAIELLTAKTDSAWGRYTRALQKAEQPVPAQPAVGTTPLVTAGRATPFATPVSPEAFVAPPQPAREIPVTVGKGRPSTVPVPPSILVPPAPVGPTVEEQIRGTAYQLNATMLELERLDMIAPGGARAAALRNDVNTLMGDLSDLLKVRPELQVEVDAIIGQTTEGMLRIGIPHGMTRFEFTSEAQYDAWEKGFRPRERGILPEPGARTWTDPSTGETWFQQMRLAPPEIPQVMEALTPGQVMLRANQDKAIHAAFAELDAADVAMTLKPLSLEARSARSIAADRLTELRILYPARFQRIQQPRLISAAEASRSRQVREAKMIVAGVAGGASALIGAIAHFTRRPIPGNVSR